MTDTDPDRLLAGLIDEARDRLDSGIADSVDDVVAQLDDEGLTGSPVYADALRRSLEATR